MFLFALNFPLWAIANMHLDVPLYIKQLMFHLHNVQWHLKEITQSRLFKTLPVLAHIIMIYLCWLQFSYSFLLTSTNKKNVERTCISLESVFPVCYICQWLRTFLIFYYFLFLQKQFLSNANVIFNWLLVK